MKKAFLTIIIWLIGILSVMAVNPRDMKFGPLQFKPSEPVRFVADNGMVVYFLEDHQLPVVSAAFYFKGGDIYDSPEKSGLAELTANLMRTGGAGDRTPDQVDQDLDFVAANISFNSGNEVLIVNMNCLRKDIHPVFGILADILIRPMFDSAKFSLEVSNKKDEILRQNDDPGQITRRVYYETVYKGHPYGRGPTLASMGLITRDDVIPQHRMYYTPDNSIVAITGDMTLDEVKALIGKYLKEWAKGTGRPAPPEMAVMKYTPGVYYAERDMNQAHIRIGHLGLDDKNPDRYAMDIMNFALGGGGFSSRMTGLIRTTAGLAYSVGTYSYNRPYGGTFFAYCQTRADATGQALKMMLDIIRQVKNEGITADEMNLARESIINSFVFGYDTPAKIVSDKAYKELMGFPSDQMEKDLAAYHAVTLEDCNRVAREYLKPDSMVIIITGNKEMFDQPLEAFGPVTDVSLEIK
nr:insulinase family protein [candidate division Zixibacteria bacterium]